MPQESRDGLPVTPAVITWARERAGFSVEEASKYFRKIEAWEKATAAPSYAQLEQMAEKFKCPVAVFFFPAPPELPTVEKSFRTIDANDLLKLPRFVRLLLRRAQAMQLNLSELNDGRNPSARLITRDLKFDPADAPVSAIASALRDYLGVSVSEQMSWSSVDDAVEQWRDALLRVGIYVFKDAFHAEKYFGFCLYDDQFPVIYVNNSASKSRQIFTLFHELGHLLFHTSGIDIAGDGIGLSAEKYARRIETICNRLAGAFLLPQDVLAQVMGRLPPNRETATLLAAKFNVSREVVYRRFLDRGWIAEAEYREAAEGWVNQRKNTKTTSGNYYNTHFSYLGRPYINLAFQRYYQNRFDEFRLSEYLNIKPRNLPAFELKYSSGK